MVEHYCFPRAKEKEEIGDFGDRFKKSSHPFGSDVPRAGSRQAAKTQRTDKNSKSNGCKLKKGGEPT
jgi:hypothetical protein